MTHLHSGKLWWVYYWKWPQTLPLLKQGKHMLVPRVMGQYTSENFEHKTAWRIPSQLQLLVASASTVHQESESLEENKNITVCSSCGTEHARVVSDWQAYWRNKELNIQGLKELETCGQLTEKLKSKFWSLIQV